MQAIESLIEREYFGNIPEEVLLLIFSFLDVDNLLSVAQVCKMWNQISEDNRIWERKFLLASLKPINYDVLKLFKGSWKRLYLEELMCLNTTVTQDVLISRNRGGFQLCKGDQNELRRLLSSPKLFSESQRDIPHYARNLSSVIWWMENKRNYSPYQLISLPLGMRWKIKKSVETGKEWIEEEHRIWKAEPYNHKTKKMKIETTGRSRKVVVDIATNELQLSSTAISRLKSLTKCFNVEHLKQIPRDHCHLLQVLYELGEKAGSTLRIITIPIDAEWFLCFKHYEYICESYRVWPTPTDQEVKNLNSSCKLFGNRLVSNLMTKSEWEKEKDQANMEGFDTFTDSLEESWNRNHKAIN